MRRCGRVFGRILARGCFVVVQNQDDTAETTRERRRAHRRLLPLLYTAQPSPPAPLPSRTGEGSRRAAVAALFLLAYAYQLRNMHPFALRHPSPVPHRRGFSLPWGGSQWEGPAGGEGSSAYVLAFSLPLSYTYGTLVDVGIPGDWGWTWP